MFSKQKELLSMMQKNCGCGDEKEYAFFLVSELEKSKLCDKIEVDKFNNVIVYIKGKNKYTVMLESHYDEISGIVCEITDEGFLRIRNIGGVDRRTLLSTEVTVEGLPGIFCSIPPHLMKKEDTEKVPEYSDIYIDLGLCADEVKKKVYIGSRINFIQQNAQLLNNRVAARALDNRVSVYIILTALKMLKKEIENKPLDISIAILFSTQEEIGGNGAKIGAYNIFPDEAIVLDVNFAKQPLTKQPLAALTDGVIIERSAYFDKRITRKLIDLARAKKIKYTIGVEAAANGTNADVITITRTGIPCSALSLPLRYMHTPVETVDMNDIEATATLIKEYIQGAAMWNC